MSEPLAQVHLPGSLTHLFRWQVFPTCTSGIPLGPHRPTLVAIPWWPHPPALVAGLPTDGVVDALPVAPKAVHKQLPVLFAGPQLLVVLGVVGLLPAYNGLLDRPLLPRARARPLRPLQGFVAIERAWPPFQPGTEKDQYKKKKSYLRGGGGDFPTFECRGSRALPSRRWAMLQGLQKGMRSIAGRAVHALP